MDNYLTFGDFDQLEQKVIELDEMTEDEISNWEKSKNFVSIRTISDAVDSAEFDFYEHVKDSLLKLYTESEINRKYEIFILKYRKSFKLRKNVGCC